MDALLRCLQRPHVHAYLFRRTYPELENTLVLEARRSIPEPLGRYQGALHDLRLVNGSVMHFRHCASEAMVSRYQGIEMHYLYIDELTHFSRNTYDFLKTRLRAAVRMGITPKVRCTSNPGGIGHGWVKQYFIEAGKAGEIRHRRIESEILGGVFERSIQYIPAKVLDNPYLDEAYILELEQKPQALRDALLHGNWDVFEGQVFTQWRDDPQAYATGKFTHVIEPFDIPADWKRIRSFDFGFARPYAVLWWAIDPYNAKVYLYREAYGCDRPNVGIQQHARDIARVIREIEDQQEEGRVITGYADPSIWDGSRGESIAHQMEREGVFFLKGENARIAGKMQLHYRLSFDEEGQARMAVFSTCRHTRRTMPELVYSRTNPEDVDSAGEDHIYDAMRYFLMSCPISPRQRVKRKAYDPLEPMKKPYKGFWQ